MEQKRFKAQLLKIGVFSDITLCQLANKHKYWRFEDTTSLQNVGNYQTTRPDVAEGLHLLYKVQSIRFMTDFIKVTDLERSTGQRTKYYQTTSVHTPSVYSIHVAIRKHFLPQWILYKTTAPLCMLSKLETPRAPGLRQAVLSNALNWHLINQRWVTTAVVAVSSTNTLQGAWFK
jgi:hypothetical protein